jgi:hypothetical protein
MFPVLLLEMFIIFLEAIILILGIYVVKSVYFAIPMWLVITSWFGINIISIIIYTINKNRVFKRNSFVVMMVLYLSIAIYLTFPISITDNWCISYIGIDFITIISMSWYIYFSNQYTK